MDRIPYEELVQRALREVVVKEALRIAASPDGLPGENHFYITFRTKAAGVVLPKELEAQYPDEMTIVLQHRYWDLDVTETSFAVTLTFGGVAARITVPFGAIVHFRDPGAPFGVELVPTIEELRAVEALPDEPPPAAIAEEPPVLEGEGGVAREEDGEGQEEAQVLSLDQFRRK